MMATIVMSICTRQAVALVQSGGAGGDILSRTTSMFGRLVLSSRLLTKLDEQIRRVLSTQKGQKSEIFPIRHEKFDQAVAACYSDENVFRKHVVIKQVIRAIVHGTFIFSGLAVEPASN